MTLRKWAALGATGLAAALVAATPVQAGWKRAESASFVVYSQGSDERLREQLAKLEDYHEFLRQLTGVTDSPAPTKLPVYMVRDRAALKVIRDLGKNAAGFYAASASGIAAFAEEGEKGPLSSEEEILFHEIAHHFMMQYRPMAYPAWFVEGFAEYVSTAQLKPKTIDFGNVSPHRAMWLANAKWLPIEQVLFAGMPPKEGEARSLFYAQSWLLAHYMMRDPARKAKFVAYVESASTGTEPRRAFADQFGSDLKAFEKDLRAYAFKQMTFSRLTRKTAAAGEAPVRIDRLPASADDLLLLEAGMHVGINEPWQAAHLAKVRAAAAKHAADAYAKRVLAEVEVLYGDGTKGETLLTELLAGAPRDAELLYLMGMRHLAAGRADDAKWEAHAAQAKTWFARAHKADPNHYQSLYRYAESLRGTGKYDSENNANVLLLARQLAPQVSEIAMNTAALLIRRKDYALAERILVPLASDPHSAGLAAAAQRMLEVARAHGKGTPGSIKKEAKAEPGAAGE